MQQLYLRDDGAVVAVVLQSLDGHEAAGRAVHRLVHHRRAAAPEHRAQRVVAHDRAGRELHIHRYVETQNLRVIAPMPMVDYALPSRS